MKEDLLELFSGFRCPNSAASWQCKMKCPMTLSLSGKKLLEATFKSPFLFLLVPILWSPCSWNAICKNCIWIVCTLHFHLEQIFFSAVPNTWIHNGKNCHGLNNGTIEQRAKLTKQWIPKSTEPSRSNFAKLLSTNVRCFKQAAIVVAPCKIYCSYSEGTYRFLGCAELKQLL